MTLLSRNMVSSCRLSVPDLDLFFQEYSKHQHQAQQFQSRMDTLMAPPSEPTTSQMQLLRQHWPDPVRSEADKPPSWLKAVAAQRDLFTNAVFTQSAEQHSKAWFILYIKKSPVQAAVLELDVNMPTQLPSTCCSRGDAWPPKFSTWSFACSALRLSLLRSNFFQEGPIFVIPHCFWSQDCLVSLEGAFELPGWSVSASSPEKTLKRRRARNLVSRRRCKSTWPTTLGWQPFSHRAPHQAQLPQRRPVPVLVCIRADFWSASLMMATSMSSGPHCRHAEFRGGPRRRWRKNTSSLRSGEAGGSNSI